MKTIIVACLVAVALASPQFSRSRQLRQGRQFQQTNQFQQSNQFQQTNQFQQSNQFQQTNQFQQPAVQRATPRPVAILRDDRQDLGNGEFTFAFEAENGISENRRGYLGVEGQTNMEGSYRIPLPDGSFAEVRYIADENGFRAESPLIPTPHPLPAHAIEQIRFAEEQRARGVTFPDY